MDVGPLGAVRSRVAQQAGWSGSMAAHDEVISELSPRQEEDLESRVSVSDDPTLRS